MVKQIAVALMAVAAWTAQLAVAHEGKVRPEVTESVVTVEPDSAKWSSCGLKEFPGCEATLLRGDPVNADSHVMVRMPAGAKFPKHWHISDQNFIGVKGKITFQAGEDGTEVVLTPGKFYFHPAGMSMQGGCSDEGPCTYYSYQNKPADFNAIAQ